MVQRSKRHRYYATEKEELMRAIADTNQAAAAMVAGFDREKELKELRRRRLSSQAVSGDEAYICVDFSIHARQGVED